MFAHEIQRPFRRDLWRSGSKRIAVELPNKGDVAHGEFPFWRAEVKIVNRKCFLEHSWIRAFRERHQH